MVQQIVKRKTENRNLSFWKGIGCIFIVFLHSQFPGFLGWWIDLISRFVVPLFFLVAGYYLYNAHTDRINEIDRLKKKIRHSLLVTVTASGIYLVYNLINFGVVGKDSFLIFFQEFFYLRGFLLLIIFNRVTFASHLWFVYSMLYCYLFLCFIDMNHANTIRRIIWSKYFAIIVLIFGIVLRCLFLYFDFTFYGIALSDVSLYRNWFFLGIPLMLLGAKIKINEERLMKIPDNVVITGSILGIMISIIEKFGCQVLFNTHLDIYLGTVLTTLCLFVWVIKHPSSCPNNRIADLGKDVSMLIYIIHPMFVLIVEKLYSAIYGSEIQIWALYAKPFIILAISLIFSYVWFLLSRIRRFQKITAAVVAFFLSIIRFLYRCKRIFARQER